MPAIKLVDFMDEPEGWGRSQGRVVYQRLIEFVEKNAGSVICAISLKGIRRLDISFASETIVELLRRFRGAKGFYLVDVANADLLENIDAAAMKKSQPVFVWEKGKVELIGAKPSAGNGEAFRFALARTQVRAAEFSEATPGMSIANASSKFKQLWQQGFLLRHESAAETGGVEFLYQRIG